MASRITADQWETYWLCDNSIGVVVVHEDHIERVAEILSERTPGLIFLWDTPAKDGTCRICAVRPDRRAIPAELEQKIVAAGEVIARNVANKHPVERRGLLARLLHKPLKPGWHYTEKQS